ncbi:MAG: protein kinase [Ruminococcus sp.]|nr:protein kinase [Ruminococcus sp.]
MGERKICYKCMKIYDNGMSICPSCGYAENTPSNPMYISPGTLLHDRYLVGVLLEYNGEGASYIAHDTSTECTVMIREYMPVNLCIRTEGTSVIEVAYDCLAKYKAFMAEFTELNKSLARLRNNSNINPVLDMFSENNTTYAVFEHIDGVKMLDYLKDNAGELSWEQISKLFPPLFTTLGILHNARIIHRAICPDTVYITNKGELKLTGFCISAVRTADAGLEYELFKGYAAPEQYSASSNSRQGSWTDVYGVCALMYRALTGCMPVDSMRRLKDDELCEPRMLSAKIPRHVSKVVMEGMNLSGCDRIQTITELVTKLFEQQTPKTIQNTTTIRKPVPENRQYNQQDYYTERQPDPQENYRNTNYEHTNNQEDYRYETVDRLKVPVIIGILLIAILMIIAVFIINMITDTQNTRQNNSANRLNSSTSTSDNVVSGDDPEQEQEESETENLDTIMPDLVGKFYEFTAEKYEDFFTLEATYDYNDEYETDMIFWQNIDPGEQLVGGRATIKVKVSKGKETVKIPEFEGLKIKEYEEKLKEAGIANYSILATKVTGFEADVVTGLQVEGKEVKPDDTFSNKDGKKLIVYYYSENVTTSNDDLFISSDSESYQATQEVYTETITQKTTTYQYVEPATTRYTTVAEVFTTYPPTTEPLVTSPPTTEPPVTSPPATDPPVTSPPATDPPVTSPPATEPPVTSPPATDPPVTSPLATDPPVTDPPIDLGSGDDPGVI